MAESFAECPQSKLFELKASIGIVSPSVIITCGFEKYFFMYFITLIISGIRTRPFLSESKRVNVSSLNSNPETGQARAVHIFGSRFSIFNTSSIVEICGCINPPF